MFTADITNKGFIISRYLFVPVQATGPSDGLGILITNMLAVFVSIHFTTLVTMVTNTTIASGRLSYLFFSVT